MPYSIHGPKAITGGKGARMRPGESVYVFEILKGLGVTMRHLLANIFDRSRMPTLEYPDAKPEYGPWLRGRHRLMKREDGSPRCVSCQMCSTICPADCISIVAKEDDRPDVEKAPESFDIDLLRCVYCGLCVEACPCDAIRMDTGIFELAADSREAFVVDIDFLLNNTTDGVKR
ncbi:MAG TPA: NADH-quinone oxidoreductase subunit I [Candidatus Krumholzibacteria bacterium]|nr:NADH-quinone oxidoreductase subunit I [Candidatus Krumholzibacteria bacterium]